MYMAREQTYLCGRVDWQEILRDNLFGLGL
jgi:hypothetical protein